MSRKNPSTSSDNAHKEWFATWFDSPYYHALYGHRDENEAAEFIQKLCASLQLKEGQLVLDLACGKGRHTRVFHRLGYNATGVDLSPESIAYAKEVSHQDIRFEVADMRSFEMNARYDLIANLFTSFGYFEKEEENSEVLHCVKKHLTKEGLFLLDFFNVHKVVASLVPSETVVKEGVKFAIERAVKDGHIVKSIQFSDNGKDFQFEEKVQAIDDAKMKELLISAGFNIVEQFGDYQLNPFKKNTSDRLILVCSYE